MTPDAAAPAGAAKASLNADYARTEISRWQARSMAISTSGIVAAESPLAAQAGAVVLARGGHAVDAAIAANAVMGVVAPMMNGVGGDLFAIVYDAASNTVHGLNASGWSPAGASIESLTARGLSTMPQQGIHAVTVPGAVSGWMALHERFGKAPLETILSAAIAHAENGFPVSEITSLEWLGSVPLLRSDASAGAIYLPNGRPPEAGEIFRNPDLARSLRAIAAHGGDAFYRGEIATRILECSENRGGAFTPADLSDYQAEWVTPLTTNYRGWEVYEIPPNSQGIAALIMLNILENFPIRDYGRGTAETLHTLIEAKKLAYADMQRHVGDPRFSKVPVEALLSKAYARAACRPDRSAPRRHRRAGRNPADARRRHDLSLLRSTPRATSSRSFRATSPTSDPGSFRTARDSRSRAAAACSRSIVRTRMRWRRASGRCRP